MRGRRTCTATVDAHCDQPQHFHSITCQDPAGHPDEHYYAETGMTVRWDDSAATATPDRDDQLKRAS